MSLLSQVSYNLSPSPQYSADFFSYHDLRTIHRLDNSPTFFSILTVSLLCFVGDERWPDDRSICSRPTNTEMHHITLRSLFMGYIFGRRSIISNKSNAFLTPQKDAHGHDTSRCSVSTHPQGVRVGHLWKTLLFSF